jgi:hypothetical protein
MALGEYGKMRMQLIGLLVLLMPFATIAKEACPDGSGPKAAVANYLGEMQNHKFSDAFPFVTANMTDGKELGEWAALQKLFYEGGGVNIFGIDIRAPLVDGEDSGCEARAIVPNVLKSRDKFNNQGTTEFEIYTVLKSDAGWQIDGQETLFDQVDIDKWMPGEKLPDFRDQY